MDSFSAASLFDPARLRIARQARMLQKKELAELINVSPGAVSLYEKGSSSPSPRVVGAMALALGVPVSFFGGDRPLGEAPSTTAHFRSLRSTTQQERDRAFSHALLTWEFACGLQKWVRLPTVDLPEDLAIDKDDSIDRIEDIARRVREHFAVAAGPIPNVVRLLESRGIVCTRIPNDSKRVFAFSCAFPSRPVVVLADRPLAASRYDAAHELGHLVLHPDEEPGSHAVERQANAFAAAFLAPSDEIRDSLPSKVDWPKLLLLKRTWGMSMQALLFRARSVGIMNEHTYRRAMTQVSAKGWRTQEPGDEAAPEKPILLSKAIELISQRGLGVAEIAKELRLNEATVSLIVGTDDRPSVKL